MGVAWGGRDGGQVQKAVSTVGERPNGRRHSGKHSRPRNDRGRAPRVSSRTVLRAWRPEHGAASLSEGLACACRNRPAPLMHELRLEFFLLLAKLSDVGLRLQEDVDGQVRRTGKWGDGQSTGHQAGRWDTLRAVDSADCSKGGRKLPATGVDTGVPQFTVPPRRGHRHGLAGRTSAT